VADSLRAAITSIEITNDMKGHAASAAHIGGNRERLSAVSQFLCVDLLSNGGDHLRLFRDRDYEAALSTATCELDEVEVALAQLLLATLKRRVSRLSAFQPANTTCS